ncbi:hypothetical protein A5662_00920 [Mycobacteriaceae bacterium 1482268.1]|nr:hypothetical protein A5662_00920 [Mycobacteriaceae bacterium 1482268.1]
MRTITSLHHANRGRHRAATPRRATASRSSSYAAYVGRVGALAVALGIGAAVASTPAVAWADGDNTTTQHDDAGSQNTGTPDTSTPAATHQDLGQVLNRNLQRTTDTVRKVVSGVVSSTGGAQTSTRGAGSTDDARTGGVDKQDDATDTSPTTDATSTPQQRISHNNKPPSKGAAPAADTAVKQFTSSASGVATQTRQAVHNAGETLHTATSQVAAALAPTPHAANITPTVAGLTTAAMDAAPKMAAAVPQPNPVVRVVTGLLGAIGIAPGATNGPVAPVSGPTLLGALALVRRELENTLATTSPVVDAISNSLPVDPDVATAFATAALDKAGQSLTTLAAAVKPPKNTAPVAAPDSYTANVGTPLTVAGPGVLANDSDADNNPLTAKLANKPRNGTVTVNPDGSFTYTPKAGFTGTDTFTYKASDGKTTSKPATVTITVTHPPVANNDTGTVDAGSTTNINVVANDTDSDGTVNPASVVITQQPTSGTATPNADGTVTYTSTGPAATSDSFTYTVKDNKGATSNPATVSVTVNSVNAAPVVDPTNPYSVDDLDTTTGAVSGHVNVTDPDTGDKLTYALAAPIDPAVGTVSVDSDTGTETVLLPSVALTVKFCVSDFGLR